MSDKPKRPWFRFHLLTAVLLMLAAGGIMSANLIGYEGRAVSVEYFNEKGVMHERRWGWPWPAAYSTQYPPLGRELLLEIGTMDKHNASGYVTKHVVYDVCVGALILAAIALVSESLLRRREARRP